MSGWLKGYSFTCETVDYSDGPQSRRVSIDNYLFFFWRMLRNTFDH